MTHKIAIDFGTTNSVIAHWDSSIDSPEVIPISGLSTKDLPTRLPLIPSIVYVEDGQAKKVIIGQTVLDRELERKRDNRLFRNFKRGIVASPSPPPRRVDEILWDDKRAGRSFLRNLVRRLPYQPDEIEQLVLTTPVASFESYLVWLNETLGDLVGDKIRIVDESTAAALGYAVTEPEALVLVFDFGGGTLDLSLVQLPKSREKTGGMLTRLLKAMKKEGSHTAQVIAKAGQVIGGSDIDQWLLADVLKRTNVTVQELGNDYPMLLALCEKTKIILSTDDNTDLTFEVNGRAHTVTITRLELESLLEQNGFFVALRRVVDKVMYITRQHGMYREDINYVLMVGGTSLMPSVQRVLKEYFSILAVHSNKPFTAIAEGALQVALGFGLDDYLIHAYGLRHLSPITGEHEYDEIIPMGSPYPSKKPVEVLLSAAHANQQTIEFVIGEIDTDSIARVEVKYENGQAVFVAQADQSTYQVVPLNDSESDTILANLLPPGKLRQDRLKAEFMVDKNRHLRLKC
ncbi:MAG: hypothetical protein B6242_05955 [Anaerolineaceae bacterium 4572_78]|nr:MAG: hypothetical protein B6242_05955 [Anaerolineaceae bacterium 4572_78]